ncbi:unnamed protein product [Ascophyllum nodosum]
MYGAFISSGHHDSQVVLALENRAIFKRSKRPDGASVIATSISCGECDAEGNTTLWIGVSSRKRAWVTESFSREGADPGALMDAGLHFLDETCGALDGLSTAECCKRAEMSRVLAFDGVNAAVAVIEEGIRTFTQEIPSGLFNLGLFRKSRSSWQDELMTTVSELLGTNDFQAPRFTTIESCMPTSPSPWAAVLHVTPFRVLVQQKRSDGGTEGLSLHFFHNALDTTLPETNRPQIVEDGYIIFGPEGSGAKHTSSELMIDKSNATTKRHKRDPNHPRGYISAFNFFVKDRRPSYVQNGQNAQGRSLQHNNEINKILGRAWKNATEEEKRIYEEKSTIDKRRYFEEMRAYRPPEGYARTAPRINMPKGCDGIVLDQDLAAGSASHACRRPWPAYTHYAHQERKGVLSSGSNQAKTQMSKAFGRRWRGVPSEEAALYDELEDADKERYEREANAQDSAASGPG